jgi:hypothetical protein
MDMLTRAIFHFFQFLILSLVIVMTAACAHPYFEDRTSDLADILTVSAGMGVGHQARVGPVCIGLLCTEDFADWRYGKIKGRHSKNFILSLEEDNREWGVKNGGAERGKDYYACGGWGYKGIVWAQNLPFLMSLDSVNEKHKYEPFYVDKKLIPPANPYKMRHPVFHSYYTQIEACAGFFGTVRLGVNPGEFVDFLLGWGGIDFFDDDVEMEKIRMEGAEINTR